MGYSREIYDEAMAMVNANVQKQSKNVICAKQHSMNNIPVQQKLKQNWLQQQFRPQRQY